MYHYDYQEFLDSVKTATFIHDWIEENNEEYLLDKYSIRPGEIKVKLDNADWLLYASSELAKLAGHKEILSTINKTRIRIKHGAKEELLTLLKLKGIGRIRARKLYTNGLRDLGKIKKANQTTLGQILGKKLAIDILDQLGIKEINIVTSKIKKQKKKTGQTQLHNY